MKDYVILENEYFELLIPSSLKEFGQEVLEFSTNKIKDYLDFFHESFGEKIKGAFLINRDDFIARINEVREDNSSLPPEWATGCFYGGETQILLNKDNLYDRFLTLVHETFHLLFSKFIYEKNNVDRIVWLDESLAGNFDSSTEKLIENGKFKDIIFELCKNKELLPKMCDLDFQKNNIITDDYNGYDLFKVVGRYLIETKNSDELLEYVKNFEQVIIDGESILDKSLEYFSSKFN